MFTVACVTSFFRNIHWCDDSMCVYTDYVVGVVHYVVRVYTRPSSDYRRNANSLLSPTCLSDRRK